MMRKIGCLLLSSSILLPSLAQEAPNPALELPNFELPDPSRSLTPNGTLPGFRTNFCGASNSVLVMSNVSLERALEGFQIRTGLLLSGGDLSNFAVDVDTGETVLDPVYPGILPLLLDRLCERAGCTWRDTYTIIKDPLPNQTFTELLDWTTQVYDVSASFWSRSIERLQNGASFAEPWYDASIVMVTRRKQAPSGRPDTFDPFGWLEPFDAGVWWMIVVTVIYSTVVYWLLEVVFAPATASEGDAGEKEEGKNAEDANLWDKLQPWETMWRFATAFTGQFEFGPTTGPAYLFTFSVAFFSLLMGAAYTANLASFLVVRGQPAAFPIDSVEQAVELNKRLCVWRSTQQEIVLTSRFPVYARSGNLQRMETQMEIFDAVREGSCDIAIAEAGSWEFLQRDELFNGDCSLERVGAVFENIPASFGFKSDAGSLCTSLLRDVFNVHLISMTAEGVLDELWEDHIDRTATIDCDGGSDGGNADEDPRNRRWRERQLQRRPWEQAPQMTSSTRLRKKDTADPLRLPQRELKNTGRAGAAGAGAVVAESGDGGSEEKLSLTNMGGVFLLHGILSTLAVLCAGVSWAWQRGHMAKAFGPSFQPKEKTVAREAPIMTAASTQEEEVFFERTSEAEQEAESKSLREEMNERFVAVEERLTTRLTRIEQSLMASLDEIQDYRQVLLDGNPGSWEGPAGIKQGRSSKSIPTVVLK